MHIIDFDSICERAPASDNAILFPTLQKKPILTVETYFLDQILANNPNASNLPKNNENFSTEKEYATFLSLAKNALDTQTQTIIFGVTLAETCAFMKQLYLDLGYFSIAKNAFILDFKNCPLFIGTHINHLLWSKKDCRREAKKTNFLPPPREANHQKQLKHSVNAGIISFIETYYDQTQDIEGLSQLLYEEKINPIKLARAGFFHYEKIGASLTRQDVILPFRPHEEIH